MSFGLMFRGDFMSFAGFAAIHLRLTKYPKKVLSAWSSTFQVTKPILRVRRKSSSTSIVTSRRSMIPSDLQNASSRVSLVRYFLQVPYWITPVNFRF
jgi:hypothetical protein